MGVATDCSIVSASAPVYVVVRLTCGGRIWGNWAMGRPSSETTPMSTVRIAMTIATMGRRMKKADSIDSPFLSGRQFLLAALALGTGEGEDAGGADDDDPAGAPSGAGRGSTSVPSATFCTPATTMGC